MGAYVKELLVDMADDHLSIIPRVDITLALQSLYDTGQLTERHLRALDLYIAGYTCTELEITFPDIRDLLIQSLALLAVQSGYTDDSFIVGALNIYPKFKKIAGILQQKMHTYAINL